MLKKKFVPKHLASFFEFFEGNSEMDSFYIEFKRDVENQLFLVIVYNSLIIFRI
jgi:hypothetical protein